MVKFARRGFVTRLVGSILLALLGIASLAAALPAREVAPAAAETPALELCVIATSHKGAVADAVELLDAAPEVDADYRTVTEGCQPGETEVIVVEARKGAETTPAYTHRDGDRYDVVVNLDAWRFTHAEAPVVMLHELTHVVLQDRPGADWDQQGHTVRCDSVMSRLRACILALDGLTAYDRAAIARAVTHR